MKSKTTIKTVVNKFYELAIKDEIIGFHFRHIPDFLTHLPRIHAFWYMQLLDINDEQQKKFQLFAVHRPLKITRGQVGRWMILFHEVLEENCLDNQLKEKWKKKLAHFKSIFLENDKLFQY